VYDIALNHLHIPYMILTAQLNDVNMVNLLLRVRNQANATNKYRQFPG